MTTTQKTLKNLIELWCSVKVFVPSTINVSQEANESTVSDMVNNCLVFLSDKFWGSTSYEALGCWISQQQWLVKEKVVICESFTTTDWLHNNIESVIEYCEFIKKEMKQEAISLEVNNKLYFV